MEKLEKTYKNQLSTDYELLYDLVVEKDIEILTFKDTYLKGSRIHWVAAKKFFTDLEKKEFKEYCKSHHLTFLKP